MKFVVIPAGEYMMGSNTFEDTEKPTHKVTLTQPFQLGMHEVTQDQYEKVMGTNPSSFKGPQNPVEQVTWSDAVAFCKLLSDLPEEKASGYVYRLPTEAEWEYACRAGTTSDYSFGDGDSELGDYAWYDSNSGGSSHPVGLKKPNPWGLYDMHGNVHEWVHDWLGGYSGGELTDPMGPVSGSLRVVRGGSWGTNCIQRSADRNRHSPVPRSLILGFRVVRSSIK
jgi:formylglycine-generating enzyme required for sulfatase activity